MAAEMQHLNERDLVIGQPIRWNIYDRNGHLLLHAGVVVQSAHQVVELKERGLFVRTEDIEDRKTSVPHEKPSPFLLLDGTHAQMERLIGHLGVDEPVVDKVLAIANAVQQACSIDADAALASIFVGHVDRYVAAHPIHVATLCEIVAKQFGRPPEERLSMLAAAISMNLSIVNLQTKLHAQVTPKSEGQIRENEAHPEKSVEILKQKGVTDAKWLNAVLQHHEKLDGSGFPHGLTGNEIMPMARLITLADIFCSLVTDQASRPAMLPSLALREIFQLRGKQVDAVMTEQLVKVLGIYPPGTFVRLMNGELAMVARHGKSVKAPIAFSVAGPWGAPLSVYIKRDCSQEKFAVREPVSVQEADIKVSRHRIWGYG